MARIEMSEARAGMVLSTDVLDSRGQLLMPAGKELSDGYLRGLMSRGVTHVEIVEEEPDVGVAEPDEWAAQEATSEVRHLFRKTDPQHPAIVELKGICRDRLASSIQMGGPRGSEGGTA